jgi:hypothetical protein
MLRRSGNQTPLAFDALGAVSVIASGHPALPSMSIASLRGSLYAKQGLGLWNTGGSFGSCAMA